MTKPKTNELGPVQLSQSVPVAGILAILTGLGLLLALHKFVRLSYVKSVASQTLFICIAVLLVIWGLRQLRNGVWSASKLRIFHGLNRFRIPREGLGYLVITVVMFVASFTGRSNTMMLVFCMMIGPWILNGWVAFIMCRRTIVRRRTQSRVMAGETISVEIEYENDKVLFSSWMMTVRDFIRGEHEMLEATVLFTRVPRRDRRRVEYQLRLAERGRYFFGPLEVMTRFPLGLVQRGLLIDEPGEILVHPRVGRFPTVKQRESLGGGKPVQQRATEPSLFNDELCQLREYRHGDNTSTIHWRTSARRNELTVCEYRQGLDQSLSILLDLWLPEQPNDADRERVELAVSFAATLGLEQLRDARSSRLFVAASGKNYERWEERPGQALAESLLDMLALIQAGPSSSFQRMVDDVRQNKFRSGKTFLITTRQKTDFDYGDLERAIISSRVGSNRSSLEIIEADPQQLEASFTLV